VTDCPVTRAIRSIVACTTVILSVALADARPTPGQLCQAAKIKATGAYVTCRQNAAAKLVLNGDTMNYDDALDTCETKFVSAWQKAEVKAAKAGTGCRDEPLDQALVEKVVDECILNVTTALGGGGLRDCMAELDMCTTDGLACEGELTNCQGDLVGAQACGNGIVDAGEDCDLGTLNGKTCLTQGFGSGTLVCGAGCSFDASGCFGNGPIALALSTNGTGGGTYVCRINGVGSPQPCGASYPYATSVQIIATPSATAPTHSHVTGWSGDCASAGSATTCTVTLLAPRATAITFDLDMVTVSVTISGTGSGTVTDSGGTFTCPTGICTHDYLWGVAVSFPRPTANPGSSFLAWSGACAGGNTCSLSANQMQSNQSLIATFGP